MKPELTTFTGPPIVDPAPLNKESIEITVRWGDNIVHHCQLSPLRSFFVGEGGTGPVDFFLPAEKLGTERWGLLRHDADHHDADQMAVVVPEGGSGTRAMPGAATMDELSSGERCALPPGARIQLRLADISFDIHRTSASPALPRDRLHDWNLAKYLGGSLLSVAGLLAVAAWAVPPMGLTDGEGVTREQLLLIQQYLDASAERQVEADLTKGSPIDASDDQPNNGHRDPAAGPSGGAGRLDSDRHQRLALKGPMPRRPPELTRSAALRQAVDFGMIGLLHSALTDSASLTAPWARDAALGSDPLSAMGNLWADTIGEGSGSNGLGVLGVGEGAGFQGDRIGIGAIGTIGQAPGLGISGHFGPSHHRLAAPHRPKAPRLRMGKQTIQGQLPQAVIQRIVRQNFGRFRLCYEQGLQRHPALEGRVAVRFIIDRNGAVAQASSGGSGIPDSTVADCVVRAFYGISFPKPESGIVTVVYPILLSPM